MALTLQRTPTPLTFGVITPATPAQLTYRSRVTDEQLTRPAEKRMKLRYAGTCRLCGTELPAKHEAIYERGTKTVRCVQCSPGNETPNLATAPAETVTEPEPADAGVAGSSARREYERRKARDEERIRAKWGRLGGIAVGLSDERQSTAAWERGAVGEERLGARLDELDGDGFVVMHDRRIPRSRANIDHLAVTRGGVWVIDAKRYTGRPALKIEGGILRPRVEKLIVGRRDCTKLVDGVLKQVELVRDVVGDVPVTGALCFVEADWPLIGGSFTTRGVHALWGKRLVKLLREQPDAGHDVTALGALLKASFKPA